MNHFLISIEKLDSLTSLEVMIYNGFYFIRTYNGFCFISYSLDANLISLLPHKSNITDIFMQVARLQVEYSTAKLIYSSN